MFFASALSPYRDRPSQSAPSAAEEQVVEAGRQILSYPCLCSTITARIGKRICWWPLFY